MITYIEKAAINHFPLPCKKESWPNNLLSNEIYETIIFGTSYKYNYNFVPLTKIIIESNVSHFSNKLKRTKNQLRQLFKEKLGRPENMVGSVYTVKGPIEGNEQGVKLPIVEPMNFLSQLSSGLDVKEREWVIWLGNRIMNTMKDTLEKVLDNKKPLNFKVT